MTPEWVAVWKAIGELVIYCGQIVAWVMVLVAFIKRTIPDPSEGWEWWLFHAALVAIGLAYIGKFLLRFF